MKEEFERLVKLIGEVYDGTPWYGPSVKKILTDVKEEHKNLKSGRSHTLVELILHMAAWKRYVVEVLHENFEYTVSDEQNFPTGTSLEKAIEELDTAHLMILEAIVGFHYEKLNQVIPDRKYRYFDLFHGIIHHDVYHAGQISLLMKQSQ